MSNKGKGLTSFQTFFIFGCAVGFFGIILEDQPMVWSGLALIAIGVVAGGIGK